MESNGEVEGLVSRSNHSGRSGKDRRVGLIFDERMCKHYDPYDQNHPECPDRIQVIWDLLNSSGLAKRCTILKAKDAEDNHLALVHTKNHINLIKNISSRNSESKRKRTAGKFNSIYFNEGSTEAASLAAGSVMEAAEKVAKGELDSAFAIVRPPGHHAEEGEPMGFCLYNNVGIATSYLLNERRELGIKKILIVDWDVHHGNGTQNMFYKDPRVLFFSVHRYDSGTFYPAGHDGSYIMTGEDSGAGHNINVPWEHGRCGDADYLAVWDHILIPVAKEFNPDMIIISAGFDAAIGNPLGGCCISPYGYSVMLDKLMGFAGGKIVMALEGGYNLNSIASSARACVEVLLNEKPSNMLLEAYPFAATWRVIQEVRRELSSYWPILAAELPEHIICKTTQIEILSSDSEAETENITLTVSEEVQTIDDVIQPFSNMKVDSDSQDVDQEETVKPSWRSELSKADVWYATYGSNMNMPRFSCYIEGGQIEGMKRPCVGSMDKSKPKEIIWKTFPLRLFFARECTATWGPGGVAFLHPNSNVQEKAYLCMYKFTLEQFNDVLLQENVLSPDTSHPLFGLTELQTIQTEKSISMELVQRGWYHNVVYLGNEGDIPILTMTQNFAPPSPPSSAVRLWRPAAQRNLRNQWSKLNSLRHEWSSAASSGRSHATAIVNFYLSQKYMDRMDFGVLSDMPNLRKKASYKLFRQQELCKGNLLSSYRDMVRVLTQMVQICKSMRCYVRGTSNSPLAQFSLSSDDGSDSGDCGGIPVFTFFSVASFEELALEITQMFISELNLKRLLVVEFLSICHEKDAETHGSQWSNELYKGEFDDLGTLNLYSEKTQEPNLPSLRNRNSSTSSMKSQRQQDSSVLQIYITSWLAEVNIDKCRIDEILGIVGGEMRVDFLEIFG